MVDGKATAYVCENFQCQLPVTSVDELEKVLWGDCVVTWCSHFVFWPFKSIKPNWGWCIELCIRTRGRTGVYTRPGMRACGHFLIWQNSIAQRAFVRSFCKLTKQHRAAFNKHKLQRELHTQRAYRMASPYSPVAFVQEASPVPPLVLIRVFNSMGWREIEIKQESLQAACFVDVCV